MQVNRDGESWRKWARGKYREGDRIGEDRK